MPRTGRGRYGQDSEVKNENGKKRKTRGNMVKAELERGHRRENYLHVLKADFPLPPANQEQDAPCQCSNVLWVLTWHHPTACLCRKGILSFLRKSKKEMEV